MISDRLAQLELQYSLLQEQLNNQELAKITAPPGDQVRLQQQMELFILPQLKECKQKYAQALAEGADFDRLTETQAEVVVGEFVEELNRAKTQPAIAPSDREVVLLEQILAKLSEPEKADARLKLAVKLPLQFVEAGIEWEGSAREFWQTQCPTFASWVNKAKKLMPPA
jgi:hypothetical protein